MLSSVNIDLIENVLSSAGNKIELLNENSPAVREIFDSVCNSFLMSEYRSISIFKAIKVLHGVFDAHLLITEVSYSLRNGKFNIENTEPQLIGYKKLDNNYGHILIRPETLEDKISGLFIKTEIDFKNYPEFSSRYYFAGDNELSANSFATSRRLELMEKQRELLVEVTGDILISKFSRVITSDDCNSMIGFIRDI